ncbi:MAG: VWA domain-containing protein [Candidatus Altiarchaeota archaeon]|nr:VWA domain-containing protein [Candidatus Altiarchaeota archaeon]
MQDPRVLLLLVPLALLYYLYLGRPAMSLKRWVFLSSRMLLFALVLVALSRPYSVELQERFQDVASVTVLIDGSESMALYGNSGIGETLSKGIGEAMKNSTGFQRVQVKEFAGGNRTTIGDALYQNSAEFDKETNLIILVSDGNNNYGRDAGDVARMITQAGARVFTLSPANATDEVYVMGISGIKKTPANADYFFTVDAGKLGKAASYRLDVYAGEKEIASEYVTQTDEFLGRNYTVSFKEQGVHVLTARLVPESRDAIDINNFFAKTVDVVDKPKVLVVTGEKTYSPLVSLLGRNYDVTVVSDAKKISDYGAYAAAYLDNQNTEALSGDVIKALQKHVIDGGGLVVVGGDKAYEKGGYKDNPQLEALLPVRSVEQPEKKRKEIAVIILLDISQSTAYGLQSESKINVEKGLALNIIRQLDPKDYVGVVAFNVEAFTVSDMERLENNLGEMEDKIPRLMFGGGTDLLPGLEVADQTLKDVSYDKYVVLISDGVIGVRSTAREARTLEKVRSMGERGITVYTIGVGFDTNEAFMASLASEGRGIYFQPDAWERLKLEFEEKDADRNKDRYGIAVYDRYHFITQDLRLPETAIGNYNDVTPKSIAQVLITTEDKKPIVTAWRFGLGRVVSLTTDNGLSWSPAFYSSDNGRAVSAITNWVIGDLERKKEVLIETADVSLGRDAEVVVRSAAKPALYVQPSSGDAEELSLKQTDLELYGVQFTLNDTGVYALKALGGESEDTDAVAVNYPVEYARLGVNAEGLADISEATGGRHYGASETEALVMDAVAYVKEGSLRSVKEKTPLDFPFIAAAVSLFFVDVVARRVMEIRRLRSI